jgi:outer membrane lipoprotein-sorting protein
VGLSFIAAVAARGQASPANSLESALTSMDKAAANFKTTQSKFQWDQYEKVVDETESQTGTMYFRRSGNNIEMSAHIDKPDTKIVLFTDGLVRIYQPKIDTEQRYNAGKNREAFESFLVLGFGGRGHDLAKSFDVQFDGSEAVDGINAAKLVLTPKEDKVKNVFNKIILWIDPARGISVQQKFFEPSGNYRLAKYSDIKINQKLPDNAFKINTTRKTKVVTPNG